MRNDAPTAEFLLSFDFLGLFCWNDKIHITIILTEAAISRLTTRIDNTENWSGSARLSSRPAPESEL